MDYMSLITLRKASALTGISELALKEAIMRKTNPLPAFRAGSHIMIPYCELEQWIGKQANAVKENHFIPGTWEDELLKVIILLCESNNGTWEGSCSDIINKLVELNVNCVTKLSPTSAGKTLANMTKKLSDNGIKHITARSAKRMNYFFIIE